MILEVSFKYPFLFIIPSKMCNNKMKIEFDQAKTGDFVVFSRWLAREARQGSILGEMGYHNHTTNSWRDYVHNYF